MWSLLLVSLFLFSPICSLNISDICSSNFVDYCHETHALGLETLIRTAGALAEKEGVSIRNKYQKAVSHAKTVMESRSRTGENDADPTWNPLCPTPSPRMFTTAPPPTQPPAPTTTTEAATSAAATSTAATSAAATSAAATSAAATSKAATSKAATSTAATSTAATSTAATSTAAETGTSSSSSIGTTAGPTNTPPAKDAKKFKASPLYFDHESDPLASHMNLLHKYVSAPKHACSNEFTDLNSITEHQLYGFLASLVTTDVGPFCSICHRMVDEVRKRASAIGVLISEEEQLMANILRSHIPSTKSICSAIAPACYDNYEMRAVNITSSLICAECSACMIVTNVLQHRLLLKKDVVAALYNFLKETLFHNICAEMCNVFAGQKYELWPKGFTYNGCQNWFQSLYDGTIRFITTVTRPERFCSLELGWCDLNEVPNMLQCLPEFCKDFLGNHPHLRCVCNLLPNNKEEADKFLNVHHSKKYKEKKAYHDNISVEHNEL